MKPEAANMRVHLSLSAAYKVANNLGTITANWKTDLNEEEFEGYVPEGCKVLEIEIVLAKTVGQGDGAKLVKEFLASDVAKSADMIYLDPVPGIGVFAGKSIPREHQVSKLKLLYAGLGFISNPMSNRMWFVRNGHIADADLPK